MVSEPTVTVLAMDEARDHPNRPDPKIETLRSAGEAAGQCGCQIDEEAAEADARRNTPNST